MAETLTELERMYTMLSDLTSQAEQLWETAFQAEWQLETALADFNG